MADMWEVEGEGGSDASVAQGRCEGGGTGAGT
jgi:hypothetical protein